MKKEREGIIRRNRILCIGVAIFSLLFWTGKGIALFEPPEWLTTEKEILHIIFGESKDFKTYLYSNNIRMYVYNYKTAKLAEIDLFVAAKTWEGEISSEKSLLLSRFPYNATWKKGKDNTCSSIWFRFGSSIVGVEFSKGINLDKAIKIGEEIIKGEEERQKKMFSIPLSALSTFQSAVKEEDWDKARSCLATSLPPEVEAYWDYMKTFLPTFIKMTRTRGVFMQIHPLIGKPIIKGDTAQVKIDFSKMPSEERGYSPIVFFLSGGQYRKSTTVNFIKEDGLWKIYLASSPLKEQVEKARGSAHKVVCLTNLKQIGLGLHMYVNDHKKFPESLKELYPKYITKADIFRCPADKNIKEIKTLSKDTIISYTYVSGLTKDNPPDMVVAYDASLKNHQDGRNVLFLDGHVKWHKEAEFQKLLEKTKLYFKKEK